MLNNVVYFPLAHNLRWGYLLERLGFWEDYLDRWGRKVFEYLKGKDRDSWAMEHRINEVVGWLKNLSAAK